MPRRLSTHVFGFILRLKAFCNQFYLPDIVCHILYGDVDLKKHAYNYVYISYYDVALSYNILCVYVDVI